MQESSGLRPYDPLSCGFCLHGLRWWPECQPSRLHSRQLDGGRIKKGQRFQVYSRCPELPLNVCVYLLGQNLCGHTQLQGRLGNVVFMLGETVCDRVCC
jgi:hypothetical protein